MKANKTQPNNLSVESYLNNIENELRRNDAIQLAKIMEESTKTKPTMWGPSIVGYGTHHYVYESGRSGDTVAVGFAARKKALVLYGLLFYDQNNENIDLAKTLGPHTHGKGCLYIKKLADINLDVLEKMIIAAFKHRQTL